MHSQSKLVTNPMVYDSFDCIERSVVFCLLFLDFFFLFVSLAHKVHTSSTHTQTHTHRARTLHTSPIAGQRRKCMIDDWLFSEFLTRAKQKVFTWFPVCCCCFCCHHHWCSSAFSIWFQCIHTFYITWNNALEENQKKRRRERERESKIHHRHCTFTWNCLLGSTTTDELKWITTVGKKHKKHWKRCM